MPIDAKKWLYHLESRKRKKKEWANERTNERRADIRIHQLLVLFATLRLVYLNWLSFVATIYTARPRHIELFVPSCIRYHITYNKAIVAFYHDAPCPTNQCVHTLYAHTSSQWSVVLLYSIFFIWLSDKCLCLWTCVCVCEREWVYLYAPESVRVREFCSCPFWPVHINWNERIHFSEKHLNTSVGGHQNTFWIRLFQFSLSLTSVLLLISVLHSSIPLVVLWVFELLVHWCVKRFCAGN